jgi:hypothetical protein
MLTFWAKIGVVKEASSKTEANAWRHHRIGYSLRNKILLRKYTAPPGKKQMSRSIGTVP